MIVSVRLEALGESGCIQYYLTSVLTVNLPFKKSQVQRKEFPNRRPRIAGHDTTPPARKTALQSDMECLLFFRVNHRITLHYWKVNFLSKYLYHHALRVRTGRPGRESSASFALLGGSIRPSCSGSSLLAFASLRGFCTSSVPVCTRYREKFFRAALALVIRYPRFTRTSLFRRPIDLSIAAQPPIIAAHRLLSIFEISSKAAPRRSAVPGSNTVTAHDQYFAR